MEIQRKCQWCGKPFIAHTMVTRFCSKSCTEKAYKDRKRKQKLQEYEARQSEQPMQEVGIVGGKPFLSPAEAATLLGISRATIYRHMASGIIRALQLRGRTIIRKSDIEKMFDDAPGYKKRSYGRKQTVLYYTTNEILELSLIHISEPTRFWRSTKFRRKPCIVDASYTTSLRLKKVTVYSTTAPL